MSVQEIEAAIAQLPPEDALNLMRRLTLPPQNEQEIWLSLSLQNLERAYGPDEPDYPDTLLIEENPDYEAG